ncbi:hypothetical protein KUCAC02_035010, partial [Chaenocephalus aceratus]
MFPVSAAGRCCGVESQTDPAGPRDAESILCSLLSGDLLQQEAEKPSPAHTHSLTRDVCAPRARGTSHAVSPPPS